MSLKSEIILLIISGGLLAIGVYIWHRGNHLLMHGKRTKAIVFKNNRVAGLYYPVVRFLTEDKQWITQELPMGYRPPLEEGLELEVRYDPDEPTTVEIDSIHQLAIIPRLLVIIGLCGILFVFLEFFNIIKLNPEP